MTYSPVIILGMHRSGTSMISRFLEEMGMFMGARKDVNNEAIFFLDLNNWMLREANASWDRPDNFQFINSTYKREVFRLIEKHFRSFIRRSIYLGYRKALRCGNIKDIDIPWGWKDPRNTITINIWKEVFPMAKLIHVYRNPLDVAESLRRREQIERSKTEVGDRRNLKNYLKEYTLSGTVTYQYSYRVENIHEGIQLWETYVGKAFSIEQSLNCQIIHVRYEDFLEEPVREMGRILDFLDLDLNRSNLEEITSGANRSRKWAFLESEELTKVYEEIRNGEMMRKLNYNRII